MRHRLLVVILLTVLFAWPASIHGQSPPKAMVLAWDGTVPSYVHRLLGEGKLPNLAKLIEGGAFADSVIPSFPSLTAPGFASLWTGAPPRLTGISGNRVPPMPRHQHTILESESGFNGVLLRAEPLWVTADRSGRRVVLSHGPFAGERPEQVFQFEGYSGIAGRDGVVTSRTAKPSPPTGWKNLPESAAQPLEIGFTVGGSAVFGLLIDDPMDPHKGYDTLLITEVKDGKEIKARLKVGAPQPERLLLWSGVIELKAMNEKGAGTYFRLFELKADGSDFLLYFTRPTRDIVSHPQLLADSRRKAGAFIGNGASRLYSQGAFGPPIPKGGNGIAEARYVETVALVQRQLMETSLWALRNLPWDLFFAYTPYPDEAEHLWRGYLEPSLPGARSEIAQRLQPFLEQVYRMCDDFLGVLLAHRPKNTVLALVSDHGMEGVNRLVGINRALQHGGLLVTDENGYVDVSKTQAFYPFMSNGYLVINTTDRKGGIVSPQERPEIVRKVRDLLLQMRDGNRHVVAKIYDAEKDGMTMGIGGEAGGDIYVDLLPGYGFETRTGPGKLITNRDAHGVHGFNPLRPSMRTLMVFNGPGVLAGQRLRDVRLVDFAPTLAKLLGIPIPKDATGRALEGAFSNSR